MTRCSSDSRKYDSKLIWYWAAKVKCKAADRAGAKLATITTTAVKIVWNNNRHKQILIDRKRAFKFHPSDVVCNTVLSRR